jgi:hypothetical protein
VTALTVADVMGERNLLPGDAEGWGKFTVSIRDEDVTDKALEALACISYVSFPEKAKTLFGNILLARPKLIAWTKYKGYALPAFLTPREAPQNDKRVNHADIQARARSTENPPARTPPTPNPPASGPGTDGPRGRRPKPAWKRICELVQSMHAANPKT